MYVGITRARRGLVITHCAKRKKGGENVSCEPSRFLAEMEGSDVRRAGAAETDPDAARAEGQRRLSALKAMLGSK